MTFGAAFLGQSSSTRAAQMPNKMRSDTVCVYVFVWVVGARSQLPTSSLWQNRLIVCEKAFALPEEFSVSLSYGFAFKVRER